MSTPRCATVVAIAFAQSAEVQAWHMAISGEEGEDICRTLGNLFDLGHIAGFSIRPVGDCSFGSLIADLETRLGAVTVGACLKAAGPSAHVRPAFLVPVWPFDHEIGGRPGSTGRFLGLDLELIATPSPDEELGAHLPGRDGLWLIHAGPMF